MLIALACLVCVGNPAAALTITFNSISIGGDFPYIEQGFTFGMSGAAFPHYGDGATPQTSALSWHEAMGNSNLGIVRLTANDLSNFDLNSFQIAGLDRSAGNTFVVSAPLHSTQIIPAAGTFEVNFQNVPFVDFGFTLPGGIDNSGSVSLDNVVLNETVAVPGPVAGAGLPGLIIAAGGFLGWWRRRSRRSHPRR